MVVSNKRAPKNLDPADPPKGYTYLILGNPYLGVTPMIHSFLCYPPRRLGDRRKVPKGSHVAPFLGLSCFLARGIPIYYLKTNYIGGVWIVTIRSSARSGNRDAKPFKSRWVFP